MCSATLISAVLILATSSADAVHNLGPEQFVQAGGANIVAGTYSVPSYADWDNDGIKDLIVGESTPDDRGKVRVYLNIGRSYAPEFSAYCYAQTTSGDLECVALGCLGCFPRVVYWNNDDLKDLLVGQADGTIKIFLNTNTDATPIFDLGTLVQVGPPGSKVDIDVGNQATPGFLDWNNDGKRDLVTGAYDGKIHLFLNSGTDTSPDFQAETFAQDNGADLLVETYRSSPDVVDLNYDGKKDILTGDTDGQLRFYRNVGTDAAPAFCGYELVTADGVVIDLLATRSSPFVCDWTDDGLLDVLVGASDGAVRLYEEGWVLPTCHSILAWRSVREHGYPGELSVHLDPVAEGPDNATTEPRVAGLQVIEVDFDSDVTAYFTPNQVRITGGTLAVDTSVPEGGDYLINDGTTLRIPLTGSTNQTCYRIDISNSVAGLPFPYKALCGLAGILNRTDCYIATLEGDTNGDRKTNALDRGQVKVSELAGDSPVDYPRRDVNTDGRIDALDRGTVKVRELGTANSVNCP